MSLIPSANAASCATTTGDDSCVIVLGDEGDLQDGQAGTDTLTFSGGGTFVLDADQFGTAAPANLRNFELAIVNAGTTVEITSAANDAPSPLTWTIDGTLTVLGAGGNAIGDASSVAIGGTGIFNVDESEAIGALSGTGLIAIANGEVLSAGSAASTSTFSGDISGAGGFTKIGFGELVLDSDNSFTGDLTVSAGRLEIGHAGAIDQAASVTIETGAELTGTAAYTINGPLTIEGNAFNFGRLTGNATINGNVESSGGLQPGNTSIPPGATTDNPGQDMGQITINGNYTATGPNAYVGMFVDIDAALPANGTPGTTHDFLDINGDVSGTTTVSLAEFDAAADTGLATTGNGIQLIRVTGASNGTAFRQGTAINAGIYQYLLTYVEDYAGTDDGYFLQSALRDEMVAHPALLSASQQMVRQCFRDDQRVPDSPKGATYGRAWAGYHQGATNYGADTGIDMDLDFSCTTGGMDWRMGHGWFGGVSGGFGSANGDLIAPAGAATLDGDARAIEVYASFTSSAFFVNLSAGYADMDWTYVGTLLRATQTAVSGFIGQAQAGVALDLDLIAVKIFGAVNYDDTNCGESCFDFAVTEDTGLLEGKASVRFDGVGWGGSVRPWAAVSYSDVLSDGINTVAAGGASISADTNSELLSIDAGLQAYLDENFALFADGGYHESLSKDISGYKGGVGLKLYW